MVKRIFSWFLLLLVLQTLCIGLWHSVQTHQWKESVERRIRQGIPNYQANEMYVSDADFPNLDWRENKKEFVLDNQFYDVISIQKVYGGNIVKCLEDKQEKKMVEKYMKMHHDENQGGTKWVRLHMVFLQYLPASSLTYCLVTLQTTTVKVLASYSFSIKDFHSKIPSPPPNV